MKLIKAEFKQCCPSSNKAFFTIILQYGTGRKKEHTVCICGDTGKVLPKWCQQYREDILSYNLMPLVLAITAFRENYLNRENDTFND